MPETGDISALFEDGAAIDAALAKAAEGARQEARLLGRPVIIWQDGQVVEVPPDQIPDGSPQAAPSTTRARRPGRGILLMTTDLLLRRLGVDRLASSRCADWTPPADAPSADPFEHAVESRSREPLSPAGQ